MAESKWIIGIDEVGRGPLAGPVGVGVVLVPGNFLWDKKLPGVTDSKKLTEAKREEIFKLAHRLRRQQEIDWSVTMASAQQIDERGIQWAIRHAMKQALTSLEKRAKNCPFDEKVSKRGGVYVPQQSVVKLDGGLTAPERYKEQETIIKGDAKEPTIGLASIMAKVTRDRYMVRKGGEAPFTAYDFAMHKGYGTKAHRTAIAQHGLSPEQRATYCKNIDKL